MLIAQMRSDAKLPAELVGVSSDDSSAESGRQEEFKEAAQGMAVTVCQQTTPSKRLLSDAARLMSVVSLVQQEKGKQQQAQLQAC